MEFNIWWSDKLKFTPVYKNVPKFLQSMANRLAQGFARYGGPDQHKLYFTRMQMEIKAYKKTGNMEHLYNIANYCLLESMTPENPKFHYDDKVDSVTRGKLGGNIH